jgi:hypothetical protein
MVRETLNLGPPAVWLPDPRVEIPIAFDLCGPDDPNPRVLVHGDRGFVVVAALCGDLFCGGPVGFAALERTGEDETVAIGFGVRDPRRPSDVAVGGNGGVVVLSQSGREFRD